MICRLGRATIVGLILCVVHAEHSVERPIAAGSRVERAIGGRPLSRGSHPWLVLLRATIVTSTFLGFPISHRHVFCGGTVINDRWVATAAHCFMEYGHVARNARIWEVRLASEKIRASPAEHVMNFLGELLRISNLRQWEIPVERFIIHPQYNASNLWANDLALVKLRTPVPSGPQFSYIRRLELPDPTVDENFPSVGQVCFTSGWGCTEAGGRPSRVARKIILPIFDSSACNSYYGFRINRQICAGHRNRGVGVCAGDSGSPLVCQKDGRDILAGIVSFTSRDYPGNFPAVFTKLNDYVPWIRSVISL